MSNSWTESEDATAPEGSAPPGDGVFAGDTGRLPVETRRVLVQLLLGPSLDATRQRHLWPVLLRDEAELRSRLHELFLELVVDIDQQVAFTRQVTAEDLDAPVLLRRSHLTFIETALILFLRQRLTQSEAQGERAVVSAQEMRDQLSVFERAGNPDQARFARQVDAAIEKAKKLNLVRLLGRGEPRFEISPTLRLLFPAEQIQALTQTYQALLARAQGGEDVGAPSNDNNDNNDDSGSDEQEEFA
jgi:Domain of unknown function (DUF4194)